MIVLYIAVGALILIGAAVMNPLSFAVGLGAGMLYRLARGAGTRPGVVVSFLIGAMLGILVKAVFGVGDPILGAWATVVGFFASRWLPLGADRAR